VNTRCEDDAMSAPATCGQGLAARSALQAKLGELIDAVAAVLAHHAQAIDLNDDAGKEERRAYDSLVARHRDAAAHLTALASEMAGYRDLPMANHDRASLASVEAAEVFEHAVRLERELVELLRQRVGEDEQLLASMKNAVTG
jgi:hypothetical protein